MVLLYKYDLEDNLNNQKKFNDLQKLVNRDLLKVNVVIKEKIKNEINYIPQVAAHLVKAGGKRIRPMLSLVCAQLCNYKNGMEHINLSACFAIETFKSKTLKFTSAYFPTYAAIDITPRGTVTLVNHDSGSPVLISSIPRYGGTTNSILDDMINYLAYFIFYQGV